MMTRKKTLKNKIAVITDTHLGARGSSVFREYFKMYWRDVFFPALNELGITTIIHGGDFFDNRTNIHVEDLNYVINEFNDLLRENNITMHIVAGNHDVCYKNTNDINALVLLDKKHVHVYDKQITELVIDNQKFLMVPWITNSNVDETIESINAYKDKSNTIVVGHFEVTGAVMYPGSICDHGLDATLFDKFQSVWSGHFHQKSAYCNINYLGGLFELNWQDYNQPRGYHVFDTNNKELTFIPNVYSLFHQVTYNYDSIKADINTSNVYANRFVRMIVDTEYNKVQLLEIQNLIQKQRPIALQVIDKTIITKKDETVVDDDMRDNTQCITTIDSVVRIAKGLGKSDTLINRLTDLFKRAEDKMAAGE
jgi:DNA repair exonuclease SbcCD nuclease subunit